MRQQGIRHLFGRQDVVGVASGDRAAWHAIVLHGSRVLHHRHAAARLDFLQPRVPSVPVPDKMMPIACSCWSAAANTERSRRPSAGCAARWAR